MCRRPLGSRPPRGERGCTQVHPSSHSRSSYALWQDCPNTRNWEETMKRQICAALAIVAALGAVRAVAQPAANPVDAHLAAAKAAAGFDFTGTLARICIAPQTAPGADVRPPPPPDRATWFTEPGKVFDNLYFVGTKIHSSWALTSREGIIL